MNRTTVFDANDGRQLLVVNDDLTQVKEGGDFYVGQMRNVVREVKRDDQDNLVIYVEAPAERCPTCGRS